MKYIALIILIISLPAHAITGEDAFNWNCKSTDQTEFFSLQGQAINTSDFKLNIYRFFNNSEEIEKQNFKFIFELDGVMKELSDTTTQATNLLDNLDPEESHLPWSSHSLFVRWEQNQFFQNVVINIKRDGDFSCHKSSNGESIKRRRATGTITIDLQDVPVTCVQSPVSGQVTTLDHCQEI